MLQRLLTSAFLFLMVTNGAVCRADEAADRAEVQSFVREMDALRTTDSTAALSRTQEYIRGHAQLSPVLLTQLDITLAKIHFENLKALDKAVAVLEAGMERSPSVAARLPLVTQKFKLLDQAGQKAQAIAYFKQVMPQYLESPFSDMWPFRDVMASYRQLVQRHGKPEDLIEVLRPALAAHPELVAHETASALLARNLLKQAPGAPGSAQATEALGWARLFWMTCDFKEGTLNGATALLQSAWLAKDGNNAQNTAFLKAMQDAAAPNPLKDVASPPQDTKVIDELLQSLPAASTHSRVTLLLLAGRNGEAMLLAQRQLLDNPTADATKTALEIARVFKATDLNLVRANAYLEYFQSGKGTNPLDEFYQQHPAGAAQ